MAIVKISDLPLVDSPVEGTDLFVVVQDNVTKKAYASDIQTYVGFEEVQYATAGQTVFNLTTMTYAAGANNLMVFVDGVNQYEGLAYQETDNNTVTFTQGLHEGAVVKFSTVQTQTSLVNSAGAVTFLQAGTGAVPRSVQSKERDIVSVKDFGAVGDGVTDDTAAIQAALNAVSASSIARALYVPKGVYKISSGLTFSVPIKFFGDGYDISAETGSVIKTTQTSGVAIEFNNASGSFDNGVIIEGLMVVGPGSGSAVGFQIEGGVWPNSIFRNLTAKSMGSHGFNFVDCISANVENCRSQGNGGTGYTVSQSNALRFRGCTAESNGSHGWDFTSNGIPGERVAPSLVQCLSEENAGDAIRINQYTGVLISECYLQVASLSNLDYACIRLDTCTSVSIINNFLTSNVGWPLFSGVNMVGALFCQIIGNNFRGGFIDGRDLVENATSGRNLLFGNSGNGTQGAASYTTASTTGSVFQSSMGTGSDYGQEWYAGYHRFGKIDKTPLLDATAAGVKVYSPAGANSYTYPFYLGAYALWVDSTGDLRIKNGAPSSDTDGTVVGTQS